MNAQDQRQSQRVGSRGKVSIILEGTGPITATINDVSEDGCGLQAAQSVESGVTVELDGDGFWAQGVVKYCYPC